MECHDLDSNVRDISKAHLAYVFWLEIIIGRRYKISLFLDFLLFI